MNREALAAYPLAARLAQEPSDVLRDIEPILRDMLHALAALPDPVSADDALAVIRDAILRVNEHADDIETVEREAILGIVYEAGALAGLSADDQYAEEWRGDW